MLRIETGMILVALLIAFVRPKFGSSFFDRVERQLALLARNQKLSVLLVGITALALRAAVLPISPIPEPIVHDEFGYLLAADTFAHGRLTNPTPPMWEHFETFSELMKPTYQCFGQPGQGLLLAFGKVFLGHPFWGVWLSCGLMCAAITWMLQGWFSPEWALLGGFVTVVRYGIFGYWADSYWGGALAAIGGALVLGALPRIKKFHRLGDALLMGLGLAILANSRPYEGVVFSVPVAIALFAWMLGKNRPSARVILRRVVLPLTIVLAVTLVWLGYYFYRVTGSPFKMPYTVERQTYAIAPLLLWQHVHSEPAYHNAVFKKMYEEDLEGFQYSWSVVTLVAKAIVGWRFFLGPVLTLPFLLLMVTLPSNFSFRKLTPSTRFLLLAFTIFIAGTLLETYYSPHYSAPATCLIIALCLSALMQVRNWGTGGLLISRAIPIICIVSLGVRALALPLHISMSEYYEFAWFEKGPPNFGRKPIQTQLQSRPGNHLVLVRYRPEHRPFEEWVYNDADLDRSRIIWAREMNFPDDRHLLDYFGGRDLWLLEADAHPPELSRCTIYGQETLTVSAVCGLHYLSSPGHDSFPQR